MPRPRQMHDRVLAPVAPQAKHDIIAVATTRDALGFDTRKRVLRNKLSSELPLKPSRLLTVYGKPTIR